MTWCGHVWIFPFRVMHVEREKRERAQKSNNMRSKKVGQLSLAQERREKKKLRAHIYNLSLLLLLLLLHLLSTIEQP